MMLRRIIILLIPAIFAVCGVSAQVNVEISQEKVLENGQKFYLHTVQQGQTLYSICKAYSVKEKDVINVNPQLQTGTLSIGQVIRIPIENEVSKDGKYIVYLVKKGETLYSLLKRFNTTEKEFYDANPKLSRNESIRAGDEIYFPMKEGKQEDHATVKPVETSNENAVVQPSEDDNYIYHTVAKGETLYRITKQYDIELDDLVSANPELADRPLSINEVIRIPKKKNISTDNNVGNEVVEVDYDNEDFDNASSEVADTTMIADNEYNGYDFDDNNLSVVLLLPFEVSGNVKDLASQEKRKVLQKISHLSETSVDFYSGCLVALENFKSENVRINLKVYDIGKDSVLLKTLIAEGKFQNVDMIIGPAFKNQVEFMKSQGVDVPMLLPFVSDDAILRDYGNCIMLKPSKQDICRELANYASQMSNCNVMVVKSEKTAAASTKYMNAMRMSNVSATELNFNGGSIDAIGNTLKKDANNLVVLTFDNESSVTRVLTQLFKLTSTYKIILFADPKIMDFETVDPNYYLGVKYAYCSTNNVNYKSNDVKTFISKFHNAFLCEPNEFAYIAADAIGYFIPLLQKYGRNFINEIDTEYVYEGLGGRRIYSRSGNYAGNSYSNANVYINLIQKDFSFSVVYPKDEDSKNNNR